MPDKSSRGACNYLRIFADPPIRAWWRQMEEASALRLRAGEDDPAWVWISAIAIPLMFIAPALWNGYPLLQYDTGGYLARWYEGYLVPSRSTVFGLYLHLGEGTHFWPIVIAQSVLTVWIVWLVLRLYRIADGPYQRLAVLA